ncbi:MAG: phage tail length tape measure family protein [Pseudomonadota bacterium]
MPGAVTVGQLIVNLSANTADLKSDLAATTTTVKQSAQEMTNAWAGVTISTNNTTYAGKALIATLKEQIATFGMSETQLLQYKADLAGVGDKAKDFIDRLKEMKAEAAANAEEIKKASKHTEEFGFQTAGAKRELLVLGHELSQGNYKKFAGSILVLGERTGAASLLFSAAGLAAIGMTAGIAAVAAIAIKASIEMDNFQKALIVTNGASGLTRDGLQSMAERLESVSTGGVRAAIKALEELSATGHYSGASLEATGAVALKLAMLTGQSSEDIVKSFDGMANGVAKWAAEATKQYNFINGVQYEHIRQLELHGQKDLAVIETMKLLDASLDTQGMKVGVLKAIYLGWSDVIGRVDIALGKLFNSSTLGEAVNDEMAKLVDLKKKLAGTIADGNGDTARADALRDQISAQRRVVTAAIAAANKEELDAAKKHDDDLANQQSVADRVAIDELKKRIMTKKEKLEKATEEINGMADRENARAKAQGLAEVVTAQERQKMIDDATQKYHEKAEKGLDDRTKRLDDALIMERTGLDREKTIYDERDKMLAEYHTKFGLSDADFYAGRAAARAEYIVAEQASFEREGALIRGYVPRNAEEIAANKLKYDTLLRQHLEFLDKMGAAGTSDSTAALADDKKRFDDTIKSIESVGIAENKRLGDSISKQREHNAEIGKSKDVIDRQRQAVEDLDTAQKESDANYLRDLLQTNGLNDELRTAVEMRLTLLDQEIEKRKSLANLLGAAAIADADAKAAAQAERAWSETNKRMGDDLASAIVDGGGNGVKRLIHDMEMAFAKAVLQPILAPISNGIASFLNPAAASAQAGGIASGLGAIGSASSIYNGFAGMMSAAGSVGTGFLGSVVGGLNGAGVGSGLTSSLGLSIGEGISSTLGPTVASALGSGISAISAAVPYVAIAAAAGYVLKAAFGHGERETTGTTLTGTFGDSGFAGSTNTSWKEKGGWFSSDKTGTDVKSVDSATASQYTDAYNALKGAAASFAATLGIDASSIADRTQSLSIAITSDQAANQKAISDFFSGVGDSIAKELLPSLDAFTKAGESSSATFQRLATDYKAIDSALVAIGKSFSLVGVDSLTARERLVDLSGGIDNFVKGADFFQQNFLSQDERNAPVLKAVTEQMTALGYAGVDTRDQFKDIVVGLDLTTQAGAQTYASLMGLEQAFAQVHPAIDSAALAAKALADQQKAAEAVAKEQHGLDIQLMQAMGKAEDALSAQRSDALAALLSDAARATQAQIWAAQDAAAAIAKAQASSAAAQATAMANVNAARSALTAAVQRDTSMWQNAAANFAATGVSLRSTLQSLLIGNLSPLSVTAKLAEAKKQFDEATGANKGAAGTTYLQLLQSSGASKLELARGFAQIYTGIEDQAKAADQSAIFAQQQLAELNAQTNQLVTINTSVLTVAEGIAALGHASAIAGVSSSASAAAGAWGGGGVDVGGGVLWDSVTGFHTPWVDGSHAGGLDRVPRDGYIARTHKDEAILTAPQAQAWRAGGDSAAIKENTAVLNKVLVAITENTKHARKTADIWTRVTKDGNSLKTTAA